MTIQYIKTIHNGTVSKHGRVYRCCNQLFETDIIDQENLWFNGEGLIPKCPICGEVDTDHRPPLWQRVVMAPLRVAFCGLHLSVCTALTIFVHPERNRYKYYEYYSPWGWGKRKDCPYGKDDS